MGTLSELCKLYRRVCKCQRRLDLELQSIGNLYIRHEFREHYKRADPLQLATFIKEWQDYVTHIQYSNDVKVEFTQFSKEQQKRMDLLERTIKE